RPVVVLARADLLIAMPLRDPMAALALDRVAFGHVLAGDRRNGARLLFDDLTVLRDRLIDVGGLNHRLADRLSHLAILGHGDLSHDGLGHGLSDHRGSTRHWRATAPSAGAAAANRSHYRRTAR